MLRLFSKKNTANVMLLFIIGLVIKLPFFFNPPAIYLNEHEGLLGLWMKKYIIIDTLTTQYIFLCSAYFLTIIQAIQLNYIVNNQHLYLQYNYLPALAYILILNVLPNAQTLSVPLLINTGLITIFAFALRLYNHTNPRALIYNIGLLLSIIVLLYKPTYLFIILAFAILFIMRPFRLTEWIITCLGLLTPYYFWYAYLFLTEQWSMANDLPNIALYNPLSSIHIYTSIACIALLCLAIIGFIYWQKNSARMVIQIRKSWAVLLLALLLSLLIPFVHYPTQFSTFILCAPLLAIVIANGWLYPRKKILASIVCWFLLFYGVFMYYVNDIL